MKTLIISILFIIIATIASYEYIYFLEQPKSYFKNYASLEKSGLIKRGWVPNFIPKSATCIYEQHNIDTNWVKMTFKFDPSDTSLMSAACSVQKNQEAIIYLCNDWGSKIKIITKNGYAQYSSPGSSQLSHEALFVQSRWHKICEIMNRR
ncbi:hypothetical protein GLP25_09300 [Photobacterium phosphoreum]|uniref:hypothetical protein n=1 Tax=Photobacterium phosphoreum TaxID=659 RepID=UPI001E5E4877|nr:hypothetical protein [Photobacterium phosphoreum]MCD9483382.1 hypothetical protein [Photobacterium phosphoreum]